ncbi:MAG: hypothetical protein ACPGJE_10100 [Wenzhouxiangellaceae bacterium]
MNSAARTPFSLAAGLALLALNLAAPEPVEAQSVRAELLAGAERDHTGYGSGHKPRGHHDRHYDRHHSRHHNRGKHHGGHDDDNYYYESKYYKAKHRKARRYARQAVDQAREARDLGFYPDSPRWSLNFDRHYRWALDRPPRRLERENYRRAAKLRDLRAYHYRYGDRHGRHYRHGPYGHH